MSKDNKIFQSPENNPPCCCTSIDCCITRFMPRKPCDIFAVCKCQVNVLSQICFDDLNSEDCIRNPQTHACCEYGREAIAKKTIDETWQLRRWMHIGDGCRPLFSLEFSPRPGLICRRLQYCPTGYHQVLVEEQRDVYKNSRSTKYVKCGTECEPQRIAEWVECSNRSNGYRRARANCLLNPWLAFPSECFYSDGTPKCAGDPGVFCDTPSYVLNETVWNNNNNCSDAEPGTADQTSGWIEDKDTIYQLWPLAESIDKCVKPYTNRVFQGEVWDSGTYLYTEIFVDTYQYDVLCSEATKRFSRRHERYWAPPINNCDCSDPNCNRVWNDRMLTQEKLIYSSEYSRVEKVSIRRMSLPNSRCPCKNCRGYSGFGGTPPWTAPIPTSGALEML